MVRGRSQQKEKDLLWSSVKVFKKIRKLEQDLYSITEIDTVTAT